MAWVVISQFFEIIYFSEIYKNNTKRKFTLFQNEFGDNLMKVLVFNPFNLMAGTFTNHFMVAVALRKSQKDVWHMKNCHSWLILQHGTTIIPLKVTLMENNTCLLNYQHREIWFTLFSSKTCMWMWFSQYSDRILPYS